MTKDFYCMYCKTTGTLYRKDQATCGSKKCMVKRTNDISKNFYKNNKENQKLYAVNWAKNNPEQYKKTRFLWTQKHLPELRQKSHIIRNYKTVKVTEKIKLELALKRLSIHYNDYTDKEINKIKNGDSLLAYKYSTVEID